jgi:Tetratricopeptide repeat
VEARPASAGYRLGKFLKRHRGPAIAASIVMLTAFLGTAAVLAVQNRANADLMKSNDALKELLADARKTLPKDSPQLAGALATNSLILLQLKAYAEAEPLLRECLAIREKTQSDVWSTFNTKSLLGGALLGQKKYAEAEPLLIAGYEGMKQREKTMPPQAKDRPTAALERLVQLYEATDKPDQAARWRKELDSAKIERERSSKAPRSSSK